MEKAKKEKIRGYSAALLAAVAACMVLLYTASVAADSVLSRDGYAPSGAAPDHGPGQIGAAVCALLFTSPSFGYLLIKNRD